MKKIIAGISIFLLTLSSVYGYSPSFEDEQIIKALEVKIEKIIENKGESSRGILFEKLSYLQSNIKNNDRLVYILSQLLMSLNNSIAPIEDILTEVDNIPAELIGNQESSYIVFEEYLNFYNSRIDSELYGKNKKIEGGCGNFGIKWDDIYKDQISKFYDMSSKQKSYFTMDLIQHDIEKFQTYFKDICGANWKLDNINFDNTDKKVNNNDQYYLKLYFFYNNWYINTYNTLSYNKEASTICNTVQIDWNDMTNDRIEFIKSDMIDFNNTTYLIDFQKLESKFKDLIDEQCNGLQFN